MFGTPSFSFRQECSGGAGDWHLTPSHTFGHTWPLEASASLSLLSVTHSPHIHSCVRAFNEEFGFTHMTVLCCLASPIHLPCAQSLTLAPSAKLGATIALGICQSTVRDIRECVCPFPCNFFRRSSSQRHLTIQKSTSPIMVVVQLQTASNTW